MFAIQYISNEIFPLKKSDSCESALMFLSDWKLKELPVVEGGKVLGFVSEKVLLNAEVEKVEQCMDLNTTPYIIHEHIHVFDILAKMDQYQFGSMAVVNSEEQFLGIISSKDIQTQTFSHSALNQEGSLLVLEVKAINYSLAEISRICESNDAKIIHLMIETLKDESNNIHVSIKLNKLYLNHVIASLERFGYQTIYTNSPLDPNHALDDRYQWLVKYLNT
jgi:acetoin utilization protein AcuB